MYVCVSVCLPLKLEITSGMLMISYDISSTAFIWQLHSLLLMGVVLELKRVMETNLIRVSQHCLSCYVYNCNSH